MCFASNELGVAARNQASDGGSKKRSVLCNFLSQPARSASNEGELHASFLTQTCARCNGLARNRRAITSHRARAVTCCQGAGNKPDFHGADRKRAFRQKMDGRAADRQLQGPDRQAGDQAAAGHLLSCLAAAKACANTGIKHEGAAAAPAAVGGRARDRASQARGHQAEGRDILKNVRGSFSSCGHRNGLRYVLSAPRGAAVGFLVASTP